MEGSVAQQIQNAAGVMLRAVRSPGSNIAANLNLCLNQFLTWPFKAGPASITDTEGNNTKFDSVIFTSSQGTTEDKPVNINVDAVACATYVVDSLGRDELFAGYKRIAALKSLKRSPAPNIRYPIRTPSKAEEPNAFESPGRIITTKRIVEVRSCFLNFNLSSIAPPSRLKVRCECSFNATNKILTCAICRSENMRY